MNKIHKANQETHLLRKNVLCEKYILFVGSFCIGYVVLGNIVWIVIDNVLYTEYVLEK
jgi:hypothetical protein